MVSSVGFQLSNLNKITGFGVRKRHLMHSGHRTGRGVGRRILSSVIGTVGHALVNRLSSAVAGGSYKLTGSGRKRVGRPRRPRTHLSIAGVGIHRPRRRVHRKPRITLSGMGIRRKHRVHRRRLVLI